MDCNLYHSFLMLHYPKTIHITIMWSICWDEREDNWFGVMDVDLYGLGDGDCVHVLDRSLSSAMTGFGNHA